MMSCSEIIKNLPPPPDKNTWPWIAEVVHLFETMPNGLSWPKVTIVTPSYNQGEFIEETIRSVLLQGYPNLEYIIIDGGSTDNTIEIVSKYEQWISYWVREPDKGQADAINKGFARSSGEYLGWINSDDCLYRGTIAKMVTELQNSPEIDMVYGDVDEGYHLEGRKFKRYGQQTTIKEMLKTYCVPIPQQGSLWRRTIVQKVGGLNPEWHFVLDREFFLRIAQKFKIAYVSGTVGFFRHQSQSKSISTSYVDSWLTEISLMYQFFFQQKDLSTDLMILKNCAMGSVYLHCASIALKKGKKFLSIKFIIKAIQEDSIIFIRHYIYLNLIKIIKKKIAFIN